jgi:hypothetical protein
MALLLLGTDACHLCDDAKFLLENLNVPVTYLDITIHLEWVHFAIYIPVLYHVPTQRYLSWPFDVAAVSSFINSL